jgi:hypothetical protein
MFEDDGDTGYFYARDGDSIVDAMQLYVVKTVKDRDKSATLQIAWSDDGLKAVVVIDRYPHAVFDFATSRGYSRMNFPAPASGWTGHNWDDKAIDLFR